MSMDDNHETKHNSFHRGGLASLVLLCTIPIFAFIALKTTPHETYHLKFSSSVSTVSWQEEGTHQESITGIAHVEIADNRTMSDMTSRDTKVPNNKTVNMSPKQQGGIQSSLLAHPAPGQYGTSRLYFFSGRNIALSSRNVIDMFGSKVRTAGVVAAATGTKSRSSSPPPSKITYLAFDGGMVTHSMTIKYRPEPMEPKKICKRWEKRPSLLLSVRYPHNQWHGFCEGLMSSFQTLREAGLLPLIEVNERNEWHEISAGLFENSCPKEAVGSVGSINCTSSKRSGICNSTSDKEWCKQGVWVAPWAERPQIIPLYDTAINPRFKAFYSVFADIQQAANKLEGTCFSHMILTKTSTFNYYQGMKERSHEPSAHISLRMEASEVFRRLLLSAAKVDKTAFYGTFEGYSIPEWEMMRTRGLSNGDDQSIIGSLYVSPRVSKDLKNFDWDMIKSDELINSRQPLPQIADEAILSKVLSTTYRSIVPKTKDFIGLKAEPFGRRVVTLMTRLDVATRALLNEGDLARYVLARYNVTVHITTFAEPLPLAMDLLSKTDVLIGVHGAGWTNAVFLKPGAVAIQLFPYGWRSPGSGDPFKFFRGGNLMNIALARGAHYLAWENTRRDFSYCPSKYIPRDSWNVHPQEGWELEGRWRVYQNTWADLRTLGPVIDKAMLLAGAQPL